jgi:hypothetical protein
VKLAGEQVSRLIPGADTVGAISERMWLTRGVTWGLEHFDKPRPNHDVFLVRNSVAG